MRMRPRGRLLACHVCLLLMLLSCLGPIQREEIRFFENFDEARECLMKAGMLKPESQECESVIEEFRSRIRLNRQCQEDSDCVTSAQWPPYRESCFAMNRAWWGGNEQAELAHRTSLVCGQPMSVVSCHAPQCRVGVCVVDEPLPIPRPPRNDCSAYPKNRVYPRRGEYW
jgi:hypothetical protein